MTGTVRTAPAKKTGYHHGALREALIDAAYQLISANGRDGFTLADACRLAGVSTAAPYRHFADREALIDAAAGRGFDNLTARLRDARDAHPAGSVDAIVAMGQAYVAFVSDDREVFELMWGRNVDGPKGDDSFGSGRACFATLLQAVDAYRAARGVEDREPLAIAVPLWAIVHGTASLVLGRNLQVMVPETSADAIVETATRAFLAGLESRVGA